MKQTVAQILSLDFSEDIVLAEKSVEEYRKENEYAVFMVTYKGKQEIAFYDEVQKVIKVLDNKEN